MTSTIVSYKAAVWRVLEPHATPEKSHKRYVRMGQERGDGRGLRNLISTGERQRENHNTSK